jgi:cell division protein FtsB
MGKNEPGQLKKSFFSRFVLVFVCLFFVVAVIGFVREYAKSREVDKELASLEVELNRLKLEKNNFLKSVDSFQSEFFLEEEARTKFNLKKEGERVLVIPGTRLGDQTAGGIGDFRVVATAEGWLGWRNAVSWWNYFFADKN